MKQEILLARGAEAKIILKNNKIIKNRIKKSYRHKEIDEKIRKSRTRKEAKILEKASKIINVPLITNSNENNFFIEMEYLGKERLSEKLNSYDSKKQQEIMKSVGNQLAKLHGEDIIHGDLTTSNMILKDKKVYIIDFGLGFISKRIEDKAVDLHLIKQALEAKHWQNQEKLFQHFLKGYSLKNQDSKKVLEQLKKVESRGRYKHQ